MTSRLFLFYIAFLYVGSVHAQVVLSADGPGTTYEHINSVLAPGYNAVEVPDCIHADFGRHIDEIFDTEVNANVFRFYAHKTPDNDRCINFDRQRTEIKTYNASPDNLKGTLGETVEYKWKFKIDINFQASTSFTHLHQIKSVDGQYASIPMITLTARKANPDRIELRYTSTNNQNTIQTSNLDEFRGEWVAVTEQITFSDNGSYSIEIIRLSDNVNLLSYSNSSIDTWQDGASFARPKWGIYRSLNNSTDLRDEYVLFNNFSIEELDLLSDSDLDIEHEDLTLFPNPVQNSVRISPIESIDDLHLFNSLGKEIDITNRIKKNETLDISGLESGIYFLKIIKGNQIIKTLKCIVN
ncbi:T9SS type A sorting domain-containing protein [Winogradskyella eckloniae]|uniref:T9SS type A sorting domain-containing protein n=1 Tax=Winogradskyella eckloniae TaxID=1089306 RepID=UPI0015643D8F|nr:T9SS type A sorting domain-containing protein [Winogradskyella eckloniae]NRD18869.1 T9SS type A sorting domain-containing protein [Winogradskyella eckloniae]